MSEMAKTVTFVGIALVLAAVAFVTRSGSIATAPSADEQIGNPLFPEFTDPLAAESLRIVRYDEDLGQIQELEVKKVNGIWVLPSHDGYPADAENRIRDAATLFIDLKVIGVVPGDNESDHELYGVLEPDPEKASGGAQGIGTLVNIKGEQGQDLVNLIIGKEVEDAEGKHYVRVPGQARVFIVEIDPEKLPARFEDWIDRDLLKLNSWDIYQLVLKDYSFQVAQTLRGPITDFDQRLEVTVTNDNGEWKLEQLLAAVNDQLVEQTLQEGEELNAERLNEMRDALDELEIVDVERKPAGLREDLRTDEGFFNDQAGVDSLIERGFYPVQMPNGTVELLSSDGEVLARTKEGVEYVLRFGKVASIDTESEEGALNRYLLVSARVNEDLVPPPELEPLPDLPGSPSQDATGPADRSTEPNAAPAPETQPDLPPPANQPEAASTESAAPESTQEPPAESTQEPPESTQEPPEETPQPAAPDTGDPSTRASNDRRGTSRTATRLVAQPQADDSPSPDPASESTAADESTADTPPEEPSAEATEVAGDQPPAAESSAAESSAAESSAESGEQPLEESAESPESAQGATSGESPSASTEEGATASTEEGATAATAADIQAERERITKENQRKVDERNEKLEKAREKVRELNYRFADWYYVISEDVYKKIHLGRDDIIKRADAGTDQLPPSPEAGGFSPEMLRQLQQQLPGGGP